MKNPLNFLNKVKIYDMAWSFLAESSDFEILRSRAKA